MTVLGRLRNKRGRSNILCNLHYLAVQTKPSPPTPHHTGEKENKIFLIDQEFRREQLQSHAYMTNGLLIYGQIFAHFLILGSPSSYMTLQPLPSEFPYI
jgi:hypothetical protein